MPRVARSWRDPRRRSRRAGPSSCVAGLKQPGQPSVQPCNHTTNRAPGPFARLRGSIAWTLHGVHLTVGFGTAGGGRVGPCVVGSTRRAP